MKTALILGASLVAFATSAQAQTKDDSNRPADVEPSDDKGP